MQRTLLEVYIGKVAAGEGGFTEKLCSLLADRLCYIPAMQVSDDANRTRVEVMRISLEGKSFVPLFTHERKFRGWAEHIEQKIEPISLLGGDLCAVLGAGVGVLVDPGAEATAELSPEAVRCIATKVLSSESEKPDDDGLYEGQVWENVERVADEAGGSDFAEREDRSTSLSGLAVAARSEVEDKLGAIRSSVEERDETSPVRKDDVEVGLSAYDSLVKENGSPRVVVPDAILPASGARDHQEKKGSFLGFLRKVIGPK